MSKKRNSTSSRQEESLSYQDDSGSEYEEDLFPDNVESNHSDHRREFDNMSSLAGSSFHSYATSKSHKSVEVTPQVWAKTWEDRVKGFKARHPQEYKDIERQMMRKAIDKIERERSQRIYENKQFKGNHSCTL